MRKTRHKKRLDIAAEFLESNGHTVTRPGAASSAAPTAAPTAADPKRPRVTAGLDTANVRGTPGKLDTRSSEVPEYKENKDLRDLGVVKCAAVQLGYLAHLISAHCAACDGAYVRVHHRRSHGEPNEFELTCAKCEKHCSLGADGYHWLTLP